MQPSRSGCIIVCLQVLAVMSH